MILSREINKRNCCIALLLVLSVIERIVTMTMGRVKMSSLPHLSFWVYCACQMHH